VRFGFLYVTTHDLFLAGRGDIKSEISAQTRVMAVNRGIVNGCNNKRKYSVGEAILCEVADPSWSAMYDQHALSGEQSSIKVHIFMQQRLPRRKAAELTFLDGFRRKLRWRSSVGASSSLATPYCAVYQWSRQLRAETLWSQHNELCEKGEKDVDTCIWRAELGMEIAVPEIGDQRL
jgi:hypothetical protein